MIHAELFDKEKDKEKRKIEIVGSNIEILEDLLALIDSVTKVAFKNSDEARRGFVKEIPYLIFEAQPHMTTIDLPCPLEDLKKFGGEKE